MKNQKLKRGQKKCTECDFINAARQRVCKNCGHRFMSKNTPIKGEILDWKKLEPGALVRVIQGTGPYMISSRDTVENDEKIKAGDKICIGYTGVYKVLKLDENGIQAYGNTAANGGFTYLYMGPSKLSNLTGTYLEPYRLKIEKGKKKCQM
jgi:hypothetical protein